ncbi:unnamed protein product [Mycena citricolor]|uniref:Uncharacterized protein n=1 Tax=Mycena citricolor TaxID=2018698 RepID=A0AAD2GS65_9AGAR|nr:unnamed protein product [Mycena citricolor]
MYSEPPTIEKTAAHERSQFAIYSGGFFRVQVPWPRSYCNSTSCPRSQNCCEVSPNLKDFGSNNECLLTLEVRMGSMS